MGAYLMLLLRASAELGAMAMDGLLRILQSSNNTGTSQSDCLVSYLGHSFVGRFLALSKEAVGVFYSSNRAGNISNVFIRGY